MQEMQEMQGEKKKNWIHTSVFTLDKLKME